MIFLLAHIHLRFFSTQVYPRFSNRFFPMEKSANRKTNWLSIFFILLGCFGAHNTFQCYQVTGNGWETHKIKTWNSWDLAMKMLFDQFNMLCSSMLALLIYTQWNVENIPFFLFLNLYTPVCLVCVRIKKSKTVASFSVSLTVTLVTDWSHQSCWIISVHVMPPDIVNSLAFFMCRLKQHYPFSGSHFFTHKYQIKCIHTYISFLIRIACTISVTAE